MKNRSQIIKILLIVVVVSVIIIAGINILSIFSKQTFKAGTIFVKNVKSEILADGQIASQNQAVLHFQTGGKLTYLPYKEGDSVSQGATIASLDSYALQQQMQLAANTYQTTKNSTDQALQNKSAGVLEGQSRYTLDTTNKQGYSSITEATIVYNTVQHIVDNDLLAQNSAQINVDLANYAVSLASLSSPINGVITHEDVTVPNQNILPTTTFTVSDPNSLVFRANVNEEDADYVSVGAAAKIYLNGNKPQSYTGTVIMIHPQKLVLTTGQNVYQVDIQIPNLKKSVKFDQSGFAKIESNANSATMLVPKWTVLSNQYIWVENNGQKIMKSVTVGPEHGDEVEIVSGLSPDDRVIVSPKSVVENKYQMF